MGYYSSWPLFALSHHVVLWWIAEQIYPGRRFLDYAILGDDVVIADEKVATMYRSLITKWGVKISETKSLISHRGAAEFAKRFKVKGLTKDLSPLTIRSLLIAHHPYGAMRLPVTRLSTLCRLVGMGFKALSRIYSKPNRVVWLFRKIHGKANLPLDLWLNEGLPLDPGIVGQIHDFLRRKMAPKDLVLPPEDQLVRGELDMDLMEYTLFRGWMTSWLKYQKWYSETWSASFRGAKIEDWFKGPVVNHRWDKESMDPSVIRFGLVWKIHNLLKSNYFESPPLLANNASDSLDNWEGVRSLFMTASHRTIRLWVHRSTNSLMIPRYSNVPPREILSLIGGQKQKKMKGIETNPLETHLTLGTRIAELEVGRQEGEPTFSLVRQEGKPKQFNQPEPTFRFLSKSRAN